LRHIIIKKATQTNKEDKMTQEEKFWKSKEVLAAQAIQGRNPWGSFEHKEAHASMVKTAKRMNVNSSLLASLEIY